MEALNKILLIGLSSMAFFIITLAISTPLSSNHQVDQKLGSSSVLIKPRDTNASVGSSNEHIFIAEKSRSWLWVYSNINWGNYNGNTK